MEWTVLGKGSNVLVADAGYRGAVVTLGKQFKSHSVDGTRIKAGAACILAYIVRDAFSRGLGGMEFAVGSAARVLGPEFAEVDTYPVRVRLPAPPLPDLLLALLDLFFKLVQHHVDGRIHVAGLLLAVDLQAVDLAQRVEGNGIHTARHQLLASLRGEAFDFNVLDEFGALAVAMPVVEGQNRHSLLLRHVPAVHPNQVAAATVFTTGDVDLRGIGGGAFATAAANRVVMGGGGGSGGNNNNGADPINSSGGAGGGIIIVRAGSMSGSGDAGRGARLRRGGRAETRFLAGG